jgi:leukotriene-A4 hydrolase
MLVTCEGAVMRDVVAVGALLALAAPLVLGADARDIHSYAEPAVARVTHVDLDLTAEFASRSVGGTAALDVQAASDDAVLTLDTHGLVIAAVADADGRALAWKLGEQDAVLGAPLRISLGMTRRVVITYRTGASADALQWLGPEQTTGRIHPYLFSQGQAILTRSWIPTQDSPGIRQTWTARIVAPQPLTVVMSAEMLGPEAKPVAGGRAWRFRMQQPVAPYLIAIAIGDLAFQPLGARTGVYTEPAGLAAAVHELAGLEELVDAAEALYGPYRWGRFDLLVLPPSFPFGGMENPRLTFATPTIIAGDRSLVSLVAHELAHSWSGNLVNNATWADFWLNEGFTVYFENRIMEQVYGPERAAMLADLGWQSLQNNIASMGGLSAPDTRLHLDLAGRNPDDAVTEIAYEKGATLLRTIEAAVGRQRWDTYVKDYFDRYAFQAQTSARFLADLRANLIKGDAALEQRLGLDAWVYEPGLPDNAVHVVAAAFAKVDAAAMAWSSGTKPAVARWSTHERVRFLNQLARRQSAAQLTALTALLRLDKQRNSEVRFAWLRLAVANRHDAALPDLENFLTSMGRRKFVLPLITDLLAQGEWGIPVARRIYARARPGYHAVTTRSVDLVMASVIAPEG